MISAKVGVKKKASRVVMRNRIPIPGERARTMPAELFACSLTILVLLDWQNRLEVSFVFFLRQSEKSLKSSLVAQYFQQEYVYGGIVAAARLQRNFVLS